MKKYNKHRSTAGRLLATTALLLNAASANAQPNILLIFTDDMGINDVGAYAYPWANPYPGSGPQPIAYSATYDPLPAPNTAAALTPHIDSLGHDGIRLTSFYAAAPVCTPSRAGMLTGSYATRVDMEEVIWRDSHTHGLNPTEVTIAERLKQSGYTTALIGKWHVGTFGGSHGMDFHPLRHGFDRFFGLPASNDAWLRTLWDDASELTVPYVTATGGQLVSPLDTDTKQRYLLEAQTEVAKAFISDADAAGQPFFLLLTTHAPHVPCWPHPDFDGASGKGAYYDVVAELDHRVGEMLAHLDALGIADETLVIFTSDNGPWVTRPNPTRPEQAVGSAYPFRGHKRGANEGGARVPFLARLPGSIPPGTVTDGLGSAIDLLPTLVTLAGGELPDDRTLDGVDLWPLLSGQTSVSPRGAFHYYEENDTSAVGVRQGDLKLLQKSDYAAATGLFNLANDVQESTNLGSNSGLASLISSHNSALARRPRATSRSNWIEVEQDTVAVAEGGSATTRIRLHAPANVTVNIAHFAGDSDLSVASGSNLTFTTGNYATWQTVTLAAATDADAANGGATFRASASGLHLRELFVLEAEPALPVPTIQDLTPTARLIRQGDASYLAVSYRQPVGGTGTTGIDYRVGGRTYTIEYNLTLDGQWQSGSVVQVGEPVPAGDGMETVTVRLTTPLATPDRRFIRLRIAQ